MKQWKKFVAGICLTFVIGNYGVVAAEPMGRIEFEELQRRAEFGDGEALYDLARMYEKSTSNPENKNIAKDYLVRSAQSGYSEGEYYLGYSYFFEGNLMEKDFAKAHFWLSKAVAKENKQALFLLGLSYLNGEGVPKDIKKGEAFLVKAGTGGTAGIQKFLGDSYYEGSNSLTQNKEKAMQLLKSRLYEMELAERMKARNEIEAGKMKIEWGSQIRNYVMHPYKLVKDVRSGYESSDVEGIMNGDIDNFLKAYLMMMGQKEE